MEKIIKRLEMLKNAILLEDEEDIERATAKLKGYAFEPQLEAIIAAVEAQNYRAAMSKIKSFLTDNQGLSVYEDPEIGALKFEARLLDIQFNDLHNEKIDVEKLIAEYHHRHTLAVGDVVQEILKLRRLLAEKDKDEAAYEQAKQDEKEYRETSEREHQKKVFQLNKVERAQLKKMFREAAFNCHPDRVAPEFKAAAAKVFAELKAAYDRNDLKQVAAIVQNLKQGSFRGLSEGLSEKAQLQALVHRLRLQIGQLEKALAALKAREDYRAIQAIEDWEEHFESLRVDLEEELEGLRESFEGGEGEMNRD